MNKLHIILFTILLSLSYNVQGQEISTLSIDGIGQMEITPDISIISFELKGENIEFKEAINTLNKKLNTLNKILKKKGIKKSMINASNYRINKKFTHNYKDGSKAFTGYEASYNVNVELSANTDQINSIFNSISDEFKDLELRMRFDISSNIKYKEEILKLAIEDANVKAKLIADASGVKLLGIKRINYTNTPEAIVLRDSEASLSRTSMKSGYVSVGDFNPSKISKSTRINIIWNIE